MAENLGLSQWYNAVYRPQCTIVHGTDALAHLSPGSAPMKVDDRLGADIEGAVGPLHLANALCGHTAKLINDRFCLGVDETVKDLAADARAILDQT